MRGKFFVLTSFFIILYHLSSGQCSPDRAAVQKHIREVIESHTGLPKKAIAELDGYLQAMEKCNNRNDSTHAFLLSRLAELQYRQGNFLDAAGYYNRAITIIQQHRDKPNIVPRRLISGWFWLFMCYENLDNVPAKMNAVNNCIDIILSLNDTTNAYYSRALEARVIHHFDIGDYSRCISDAAVWEKVATAYLQLPNLTRTDTAFSKTSLLGSLGWRVQAMMAMKDFAGAEQLLLAKTKQYQRSVFDNFLAFIYGFRAQVEEGKQNIGAAEALFQKALMYAEAKQLNFTCKQIQAQLISTLYLAHKIEPGAAVRGYKLALKYSNNDPMLSDDDRMETSHILAGIGNVYVQMKRFDSASAYFNSAFENLGHGKNETTMLQESPETTRAYKKLYYIQSLFVSKAGMYLAKYGVTANKTDIIEAIRIYRLADQFTDRMRGAQTDLQSKLFWRRDVKRLYENAIEACYKLQDPKLAYYFFEKSRAILLNDQLVQQQWMRSNDILRSAQLKKEIQALELSGQKGGNVESQIFAARQQLYNLEQAIRIQNPLFDQGNDTAHLALDELQRLRLLKNDASILELFSGDSANYGLLITAGNAVLTKIDKQIFDSTASSYMRLLSDRALLNRDFPQFVNVANHLYQLLFPGNNLTHGSIIISPDGPLFPFESLLTNPRDKGSYFIWDHAVSYTYSVRFLLNNFISTSTVAKGNILGFAPVRYSMYKNLPTLAGSDESLMNIDRIFPRSTFRVGDNATRASFTQQFSSYKIIQLYTHSSDSSDRKEPVIYFADSLLYLSELMPGIIPATQLVVLSACNTGNGQLYQGEGVFSFNRGFAALGIPSSISNLWSIDNKSTYRLTELFYQYLADGLPIDKALQQAKLEFMNSATGEERLPYYWAPAILVGKTNAIAIEHRSKRTQWVLLAGVLVVVLGIGAWRILKFKV